MSVHVYPFMGISGPFIGILIRGRLRIADTSVDDDLLRAGRSLNDAARPRWRGIHHVRCLRRPLRAHAVCGRPPAAHRLRIPRRRHCRSLTLAHRGGDRLEQRGWRMPASWTSRSTRHGGQRVRADSHRPALADIERALRDDSRHVRCARRGQRSSAELAHVLFCASGRRWTTACGQGRTTGYGLMTSSPRIFWNLSSCVRLQ